MPHIQFENNGQADADLKLTVGHEQLVISRRYEIISILNDFLVAAWFLAGSVLFLFPAWVETGTWLFVLGSAQLLARPCIRLVHHIHLQKLSASTWEM